MTVRFVKEANYIVGGLELVTADDRRVCLDYSGVEKE